MLKKNIITLLILIVMCFGVGSSLIYRGFQPLDNLYELQGTVNGLGIREFPQGHKGHRYSLDFKLAETDKVYGIYIGTKDQAERNKVRDKIKIGQTYSFYIDKTVSSSMGHNLGIVVIKQEGKTIFHRNPVPNYVFGSLFVILGMVTILLFIYLHKKNKKRGL